MNLKLKIVLLTSLSVIIPALLISLVSVYSINQNFKKEVETFRADALAKAKDETKAKVDIAYNMVAREYERSQSKNFVEQNYGVRIKNLIEVAHSIVDEYHKLYEFGELSLAEAQEQAKAQLRLFRYDQGKGYFFAFDTEYPYPRILAHGLLRALEAPGIT